MKIRTRSLTLAVAVCTALATSTAALAQQSSGQLEEVVVTAQKRAESLQDVPFSVAAVTEESIRRSGSNNLVELARNVSGLAITDLGPGQSQVAIRGISAGQVVRDQAGVKESVGIYLDESPISVALFTPDLDLYDLQRVEVLRGPQGTLFGAGSSSGTLRYITAQPKLGDFEASSEFTVTSGTDAESGGGIKGMVNLPFGETAAFRAVGYYNQLPGFIDSYYPGRGKIEDVNGGERRGGRFALLWQPTERLSIMPRFVTQRLITDGYPRIDVWNILGNPYTTSQPPVDPGERGQVTQFREGLRDSFDMTDLKIEYAWDFATLTSVFSYTDRELNVKRDASQLTGSVTFDIGGTAAEVRLDSPLYDKTALTSWSEELRLASNGDGQLRWLIGAFYQQVDRDYGQSLPTPGYDKITLRIYGKNSAAYGAPPDTPFYSDLTYDFNQFALFGEGTWQFNDQWALTGGVRYYDFEEDRLLTFAGFFADQGYTDEPGSTSSDGFSPRVILSFEPNDNVLLSAQASKGFRLGGINDPLNVTLCTPQDLQVYGGQETWEDEEVWNYELGAKTVWADGRVSVNAAAFYNQIDNLQVIADAGSCSSRIILNAEAESLGGEIEVFARPSDHWDFGLSATYVQAEITETQSDANGNPIAGIRDGNRLPTAPELQAAASATYTWPWTESRQGFVNFTYQFVGSSYTQLADQEPNFGLITKTGAPAGAARMRNFGFPSISTFEFDPELPEYDIGNLRLGVTGTSWEAALFINNVWDERAFLSIDRERGRAARVGYLTNQPRTYGLTLSVNF